MKLYLSCCILFFSITTGKAVDFCVAGQNPPKASSPSQWVAGDWVLNHQDMNTCSGKLTSYVVEHYDTSNVNGSIYLSIWKPLGGNTFELVKDSLMFASLSLDSNDQQYVLNFNEKFSYIPSGSVVGVYLPTNDYLPVVGYTLSNTNYGVCVDSDSVQTIEELTCDTSGFSRIYRLHVKANIETIDCGFLNNIIHGSVTLVDDSTNYKSVAQYNCNQTGYVLDGNEHRYCTENSTWNGTEPSCVLFNCTDPGDIANGEMEGDSFTYGSTIRFYCNSGYFITGDSVISCGVNMTWNRTQSAYCSPVSCEDPGNIVNGNRNVDDFKYQSIASFTCDSGYELKGNNVIECLANETWNGSVPICDPISCGDPGVPKNGFQSNNPSFTFNSSIYFSCNPGYTLSDIELSEIVCLANGNWSKTLPVCFPVACDAPPLPVDGNITNPQNKYNYPVSVSYECNDGFFLNGSNSTMCMADKHWSNDPPQCLQMCDDFSFPNGTKDPSNSPLLIGTTLQLSCNAGYQLLGEHIIECITSGEWNNSIPECKAIAATVSTLSNSIATSKGSTMVISSSLSLSKDDSTSTDTTSFPMHLPSSTRHDSTDTTTQKTTSETNSQLPSPSELKTSTKVKQETTKTTVNILTSFKTPSTSSSLASSLFSTIDATNVSTGTDTSLPLYGAIAAIVAILLILVIVSIIATVLCLVKKKSKKYEVTSPSTAGHTNPIIDTSLYGTSMVTMKYTSSVAVEEDNRDPVNTKEPIVDPDECNDYGHLNTAITVKPSTTTIDMSGDAHCNPMYMETEFNCQSEEGNVEKSEAFYASNDDTPLPESTLKINLSDTMFEENAGGEVIDNAACEDYDDIEVDIKAPLPSFETTLPPFLSNSTLQTTNTLPALQTVVPPDSSTSTNISDLYIKTMPQEKTFIYEAPASHQSELMSQLKRKNVKNIFKNSIEMSEKLGSGFYGTVYKGKYTSQGKNVIEVAVKTLREEANSQEKVKFLQEAFIMAQFKHINVLKLHGIVINDDSCLIVTEFMEKGDLKDLLEKLKPDPGELGNTDLSHTLLNFSRQVCMGLAYLAEKGFVHRDVAARNILVNANNVCKVADFGLSRDLEDEDYYLANKQAKVPVKWTAPEALHYRKYSSASDVWSFGCLLYEIWSLGQQPFTGVTNMESIRKVERGYRLPPPPGCSVVIYELMIKCWHPEARQRPRFQDIMLKLLQQDAVVLSIPDKDVTTDSQAGILGASLKAGEKLYNELQQTYLVETT